MPYYEYHCAENGRTVEVRHAMDETLERWDDLRERAGLDVDETPADAAVVKLMSAPAALGSSPEPAPPACGPGCACAAKA